MKRNNEKYNTTILQKTMSRRDPKSSHKNKNRMRVAARILDILEKKGWNKTKLAEELGKSPSEISRWVSGTHNFNLDTISDIEFVTKEPHFASSTIRGILFSQYRGTFLHRAILPVMDPAKFVNQEA